MKFVEYWICLVEEILLWEKDVLIFGDEVCILFCCLDMFLIEVVIDDFFFVRREEVVIIGLLVVVILIEGWVFLGI